MIRTPLGFAMRDGGWKMREVPFFVSSLRFGRTVGAFVLLLGVAFAMPAKATPIGLVLDDAPDIFSAFITVDYTASTDALTADGFATTIDLGGGQQPITSGTFDLDAEIDGLGGHLRVPLRRHRR
jgi:hypothetical protein